MKARFVNEKFTDESDPIHDLGIGIYTPRSFSSNQDLYEFLYDIMPALCHVNKPIDGISKYPTLYFKGNIVKDLKNYIREYVKMTNDKGWWSFDVPTFNSYVRSRSYKESKKK